MSVNTGYVPKSWRSVAGSIEPTSQPTAPLAQGVGDKLPPAVRDSVVHEDYARRTVGQMLNALAGKTHFTLADIAEAAGADAGRLNQVCGSIPFRATMRKLLLSGRIHAGTKGRSAGDLAGKIADVASELDSVEF